jgi:hypothetical protein
MIVMGKPPEFEGFRHHDHGGPISYADMVQAAFLQLDEGTA